VASIFDVLLRGTEGDAHVWNLPNVRGDGPERHVSSRELARIEQFCRKRDEPGRGTFFCVSLIESGKPRKKEFARELPFLFCDIDFKDIDLLSEEILSRLRGLPLPPSRIHASGGGFHAFWLLSQPAKPDQFDRVERLLKWLCDLVGGDKSVTHCVALLRVPGTHNSKRGEPQLVRVVHENNAPYSLTALEEWLASTSGPAIRRRSDAGIPFLRAADDQTAFRPPIDVERRLRGMVIGGDGDSGVHITQLQCLASLASHGVDEEAATAQVLTATRALAGTENWNWQLEERNIRGMHRDAVEKFGGSRGASIEPVSLAGATNTRQMLPTWRGQSRTGEPRKTLHNARVALNTLGIKCKYDVFQSRLFIGYEGDVTHELQQLVGEASDEAIIALRRITSDKFGADFSSELMLDAVRSIAQEHRFNPVCDMLDAAEAGWDGQPRLARMAVDYVNAADTPLNCAFMFKTMVAAARRARHPGCKFDTITVLESPEGWNKSGFWRVLAGDEFYSDESIIGQNAREVQEQLSTVWIHENAELAGMRKAEVEA